jgi:predicted Kef-type K+ transport protein
LTSDDLGLLLSVFAVLLIAFGVDFHFSRKDIRRHHPAALVFAVVSLLGELATAIVLVLTWLALWSPEAWERIDDLLVFVPGSIAVLCAVTLTIETVTSHATQVWRSSAPGRHPGSAEAPPPLDGPE